MSLFRNASFLIVKNSCVREELIDLPFFLQTQLQQITVQEHLFGDFALAPLTFGMYTSPTETFPFTYQFLSVSIPISKYLNCSPIPRYTIPNAFNARSRLAKAKLIEGIKNGTIPAAISDTGATSTAGKPGDPFQHCNSHKTKVFHLPTGSTTTSTHQAKLHLQVRAPANIVDVVPNLTQTLLSGSKFADAGYTAVYDKNEVNFYEANKVKIKARAVLQGY